MDTTNDVYLQIDAYRIDEGKEATLKRQKYGMAQFVISPCTDPAAYAKAGNKDAMFKKSGVSISVVMFLYTVLIFLNGKIVAVLW